MRRSLVVVVTLLVTACASARPPPPQAAVAPVADRLLDQVPAGAPYALTLAGASLTSSGWLLQAEQVPAALRTALAAAVLAPEDLVTATTEARLTSEVARELLPLDRAALARVGWSLDDAEVVLYGHGLAPVLRVRADGPAALAALARVTRRARVPVLERSWQGVPYVVLAPSGPDKAVVVVAFLPRQVAIGLTRQPEALLPHLTSTAPAVPALAPGWQAGHRDPDAPAERTPVLWLDPAAIAARVRAGDDLAALGAVVEPACAAAVADALGQMPPVSMVYWREADVLVTSVAVALPRALADVFARGPGIAHWLPSAAMQIGWRAPTPALVAAAATLVAPIVRAGATCGDPIDDPFAGFDSSHPLALITGGTLVAEIVGGAGGIAVVLDVRDVSAIWAALKQLGPVGAFPTPGEVRTVALMPGHDANLIASPREVAVSLGAIDGPRLRRLMTSGGRAEPLAVHVDGEAWRAVQRGEVTFLGQVIGGDEPDEAVLMPFDLSLIGGVVVARYRSPLAGAAAP